MKSLADIQAELRDVFIHSRYFHDYKVLDRARTKVDNIILDIEKIKKEKKLA